jgi:DNA sulfur modification protein DndE
MNKIIFILSIFILVTACKPDSKPDPSVAALAEEAYIYGLPLVIMDISRRQATNTTTVGAQAPMNQFNFNPYFPTPDFHAVIRPNADTYYSSAWLDLTEGPVVLSLPNTNGRYHVMQIMDAFTNVFAAPGTRTTGNDGGKFLITGPNYVGDKPGGMIEYQSSTNYVWILGRTQVNSKEDGEQVVIPIMLQYKLTPVNSYTPPEFDPTVPAGSPNTIVENMSVEDFFNYLNRLLIINPPLPEDQSFMLKIKEIGVAPGAKFELSKFNQEEQKAIKNVPNNVLSQLKAQQSSLPIENGWSVLAGTGNYGTDYLFRAFVAYFALGANLPEDALYPSCVTDESGSPLNGQNKYILHFEKGKLPPARAFWSLTMYGTDGFFIENELDRYNIGDRNNMSMNPDGSLDIYIQHDNPKGDKESNWLPAPSESFNMILRVYYPKEEMLNGTWKTPPVTNVSSELVHP